MVKALLVSLLLSLSVTLRAQAVTMLPDHEGFIHLPPAEQERIIKGVMEFMVSMEVDQEKSASTSRSKNEIRSKEFQEKIFAHIKFIQNVLLSPAFAAEPDTDPFAPYRKKYAQSLSKIDNQTKGDFCIYAGWVSTIGKNKKCQHPSDMKKISNYPEVQHGENDIVCNPLIFGFKDPVKKTLLIAVATTSSVNSSLDCMNQSQGVDRGGVKAIEDPKITKARLDQLKLGYTQSNASSKATYESLTKLIHQTCLCPGSLKNMNKAYLDRIRPHRTCFALLNQYKYLRKNDCSPGAETLGLNLDVLHNVVEKNLDEMETKVNKFSSKQLKNDKDIEELTNLDKSFKTLLDKNKETDNFCQAQAAGVQTCKIISCSSPTSCTANILNSQSPTKVHTVTFVKGVGTVMSVPTQSTKQVAVTCTAPAPTCSVGECKDGACAITVAGAKLKNAADASITFGKETSKSVDVIPDGLDDKSVFSVTCAAPPKEAKCEVSKCSIDDKTQIKTCEFTVPGFATETKDQKTFTVAKDSKDKEQEIKLSDGKSVKCEIKDPETKSKCELTVTENKADKLKVDLSLVLTIVDGDTAKAPASDEITFTADATNKNLFTASASLEKIKSKLLTVSGFSTKFPEAKCEKTYPSAPEEPSIKVSKGDRKKNSQDIYIIIVTAKVEGKPDYDKKKIVWENGSKTPDDAPDTREVLDSPEDQTVCATYEGIKVPEDKSNCTKIEKTKETPPTLSLAGINKANQTFDVKATVKAGNTEYKDVLGDGLTLVWFEKNRPEPTVEEKAAREKKEADKKEADKKSENKDKTKPTGQGGDSNPPTTTPVPDKKKVETKAVDGEVQNGTGISYSTPIIATKYEICANLMKAGAVVATGCKTVPGYQPPVQQQMGPPPVPGAYRYRRW